MKQLSFMFFQSNDYLGYNFDEAASEGGIDFTKYSCILTGEYKHKTSNNLEVVADNLYNEMCYCHANSVQGWVEPQYYEECTRSSSGEYLEQVTQSCAFKHYPAQGDIVALLGYGSGHIEILYINDFGFVRTRFNPEADNKLIKEA